MSNDDKRRPKLLDRIQSERNFPLVYAFVALFAAFAIAASTTAIVAGPGHSAPIAEDCAKRIAVDTADPASVDVAIDETIRRFVHHAILRQEPICAWDISTSAVQQGDRESWRDGTPVVPYPTDSPARADASVQWVPTDLEQPVKENARGELELRVHVRVSDGTSAAIYELALVWTGSSFLVSYAQPPFGASLPASLPAGSAGQN